MTTNTQANYDGLPKSHAAVLKIIRENPLFKTDQIAKAAGLSRTRIGQIIADLKEMGKLVRIGGKRDGFWETKWWKKPIRPGVDLKTRFKLDLN